MDIPKARFLQCMLKRSCQSVRVFKCFQSISGKLTNEMEARPSCMPKSEIVSLADVIRFSTCHILRAILLISTLFSFDEANADRISMTAAICIDV